MARCEVCGYEQYPFDSKQAHGKDGRVHWFCSEAHLEAWTASGEALSCVVEPVSAAEVVKETASDAGKALAEHKVGGEVSEEAASEAARVLATAPDRVPKRRSTRKTVQRRPRRPS